MVSNAFWKRERERGGGREREGGRVEGRENVTVPFTPPRRSTLRTTPRRQQTSRRADMDACFKTFDKDE